MLTLVTVRAVCCANTSNSKGPFCANASNSKGLFCANASNSKGICAELTLVTVEGCVLLSS